MNLQNKVLASFNLHTASKLTEYLDFYECFFNYSNLSVYLHHSYYHEYSCIRIKKDNYYTISYELNNSSIDLFRKMIIDIITLDL